MTDDVFTRNKTIRTTENWPPDLYAKLRQVVMAETRVERERLVMQLLDMYTRAMLKDVRRRWLR